VKITSSLQSREYTGDIDEVLENGVKETFSKKLNFSHGVEDVIQNGIIKTNIKAWWCAIDYTNLIFDWKIDNEGRKKPYVWNGEKWLLINNLHVHSKDLESGLSKKITS
jgi:hypothetical protein